MRVKKGWHIYIAGASLILGVIIGLLFKVHNIGEKEPTVVRHEELVSTLIQVEKASAKIRAEIREINSLISTQKENDNLVSSLEKEINELKLRAGYLSVKGPGIKVTLSDSQVERGESVDPNNYFIHESFLREIVNSMLAGGAEAVAINNHRLIATSEIFCGGTTIFINKSLVVPPYEITGLGDITVIKASLDMDVLPMLTSLQRQYGIGVQIEEGEYHLPGYMGSVQVR